MFVPGLLVLLVMLFTGSAHSEAHLKVYPHIARPTAKDRVLIVAPHVDDEVIGAGGYAVDAIASGAEVYVVFLTAGDCNRFAARLLNRTFDPKAEGYLSIGRTRIAEAHSAMKLLGVPESHYFMLGYPDRGLRSIVDDRSAVVRSRGTRQMAVPYAEALSPGSLYTFDSIMSDLRQVFAIARPTIVIAPVSFDLHPDHTATSELTDLTIENLPVEPLRLGYLVHSRRIPISLVPRTEHALVPPSRMRTLDWATYPLSADVQKKKDALLQTYRSQRPYTSILRNAFIRTNELFFVYPGELMTVTVPLPALDSAAVRMQIAR